MGWEKNPHAEHWTKGKNWRAPGDKRFRYKEPPDPFTDANDDYAVLEWMRSDYRWGQFKEALIELRKIDVPWHGSQYTWNYKVGDYARAALTVLGGQP